MLLQITPTIQSICLVYLSGFFKYIINNGAWHWKSSYRINTFLNNIFENWNRKDICLQISHASTVVTFFVLLRRTFFSWYNFDCEISPKLWLGLIKNYINRNRQVAGGCRRADYVRFSCNMITCNHAPIRTSNRLVEYPHFS